MTAALLVLVFVLCQSLTAFAMGFEDDGEFFEFGDPDMFFDDGKGFVELGRDSIAEIHLDALAVGDMYIVESNILHQTLWTSIDEEAIVVLIAALVGCVTRNINILYQDIMETRCR